MQLLNVSGRICAIDENLEVETVDRRSPSISDAVERLLSLLPRGMYIAILPYGRVPPGLQVIAQDYGVIILCPKEVRLPHLTAIQYSEGDQLP